MLIIYLLFYLYCTVLVFIYLFFVGYPMERRIKLKLENPLVYQITMRVNINHNHIIIPISIYGLFVTIIFVLTIEMSASTYGMSHVGAYIDGRDVGDGLADVTIAMQPHFKL